MLWADFKAIEGSADLRENALKSRAWLRRALNSGALGQALQLLLGERDVMGSVHTTHQPPTNLQAANSRGEWTLTLI